MTTTKRPNFLIIVADDLGFSDVGCFGSEIKTPNLDKLATKGARLSDFHTAAACSPTRAMLLSGTDSHIAGVGVMSEQKGNNPQRWNKKGHEGYLNHDVAALPEILQDAGYWTAISGKWHLGLKPENNPKERGFDRSFALLPGCSNHYGWEPQFGEQAGNFFERIPPLYSSEGKKADITANTADATDGFYSSTFYASNLLKYFDEKAATPEDADKPFFAYLPFSAPHWPLQCSKEDRDLYKGVYDDGPDSLRLRRLQKLKELGLISSSAVPHPVLAGETSEWDEMTAEERELSCRSMEVYAGMVTSMDREIGRVLAYLEKKSEMENTFVIFMSDNGAEGAAYEAMPVLGPNLMKVISTFYDNSLENIGNHNSFVWYGPRWAQAATAPGRMYKMYSTEGGIRVPLILKYDGFDRHLQDGAILDSFATVMDICPTILQMAGIQHPATGSQSGIFRGREVASMRGKSWVDYMTRPAINGHAGEEGRVRAFHGSEDPVMGWELFGRAAMRKGQYKLVLVPDHAGGRSDGLWQLYDLSKDPGEVEDLRDKLPGVVRDLEREWDRYVKETGTVWGEALPLDAKGGWAGVGDDIIGGDPMEQTRAWMRIGPGCTPAVKA